MSLCVYLTHPQVVIDPEVPVPDWRLTELGRKRAALALLQPWAGAIHLVISSEERKAIETAEIFASGHNLAVTIEEGLHENDRSATGFLPPQEFEQVADQFFAHPAESIRGWETAEDAQKRIVSRVIECLEGIPRELPVLFTGHGGVGTLLKCHLMNVPISRSHDQTGGGGGCWYSFSRDALWQRNSGQLDWSPL
ncbi:histidine phosphatase family protein [Roseibium suaedae]|uniref:Broad specificity phosphatase PhoE n=1 Tax=Roseibium suaedae TaxID=735517 RepID=A0A1M6Z772_9HYPH|nr:histidine phosphatase family protein [Roseibium suaedae]SHL26282.1 Broad specificity phosphatase PhoE [Roseibium suaedae]